MDLIPKCHTHLLKEQWNIVGQNSVHLGHHILVQALEVTNILDLKEGEERGGRRIGEGSEGGRQKGGREEHV